MSDSAGERRMVCSKTDKDRQNTHNISDEGEQHISASHPSEGT